MNLCEAVPYCGQWRVLCEAVPYCGQWAFSVRPYHTEDNGWLFVSLYPTLESG